MSSARPIPLLLLLLVLLNTVGPVTAQTDVSGAYEADLMFGDVSPPCINPGYEGLLPRWGMTVLVRDGSNVDITLHDLPSAGQDIVFNASLNATLDVYAEAEGGRSVTGRFFVTGTAVSFGGQMQWLQECNTDPNDPTQRSPVPQQFGVQATRVSGGEEPQDPSPSPPEFPTSDLISRELARDALSMECGPEVDEARGSACRNAFTYASDWHRAMANDISALNLDPTSDAFAELGRLRGILSFAAQLGGLFDLGPTAAVPRFPLLHALLPVFGVLFPQGASQAARGQIDELRTTVTRADALLALALAGEAMQQPTSTSAIG